MADREDSVYQAKLAEQAERYDGKLFYYILVCPLPSKPKFCPYEHSIHSYDLLYVSSCS